MRIFLKVQHTFEGHVELIGGNSRCSGHGVIDWVWSTEFDANSSVKSSTLPLDVNIISFKEISCVKKNFTFALFKDVKLFARSIIPRMCADALTQAGKMWEVCSPDIKGGLLFPTDWFGFVREKEYTVWMTSEGGDQNLK